MSFHQRDKDWVLLGKVIGAHGIKGNVRLKLFMDDPLDVGHYEVYDPETGTSYAIRPLYTHKDTVIAEIQDVDTRTAAEALKGMSLSIAKNALPATEEDVFYQSTLIGMTVMCEGVSVGDVVTIENHGAGDLLGIALNEQQGAVLLYPFRKKFVPVIDEGQKTITVDPEYFKAFLGTSGL